jgi:hypothetical protein
MHAGCLRLKSACLLISLKCGSTTVCGLLRAKKVCEYESAREHVHVACMPAGSYYSASFCAGDREREGGWREEGGGRGGRESEGWVIEGGRGGRDEGGGGGTNPCVCHGFGQSHHVDCLPWLWTVASC